MISDWLNTSFHELWLVPLSAVTILVVAIVVVRIVGLRSLSKMSSFDFLVTVALGSTLATVAATNASLINGALAFVTFLAAQAAIAVARRSPKIASLVDNEPRLLMSGAVMYESAMHECRVTRRDVIAKLREANVTNVDQVLAVVLETTGDISVLHGDGPLDETLLEGVVGRSEPTDDKAD